MKTIKFVLKTETPENANYLKAIKIVNEIKEVNDVAEKTVALMPLFINVLNKDRL